MGFALQLSFSLWRSNVSNRKTLTHMLYSRIDKGIVSRNPFLTYWGLSNTTFSISRVNYSSRTCKLFSLPSIIKMACNQRKLKRPFIVSVEGNIGSGKSMFLNHFQTYPGVQTYTEPVSDWCDVGGHNLLSLLYQNPEKWSFAFQSTVQLSRLNIILQPTDASVKMIERSLQNNRFCFLEIGKQMGALSPPEYAVLTEWYDWLEKKADIGLDLIVYLKTSPEVAYQRMKKRQRPEEQEVPLSYIKLVHDCYESWLIENTLEVPPAPVLVLDANRSLEDVFKAYEENREKILGFHGMA